jgi:hypothetical protein
MWPWGHWPLSPIWGSHCSRRTRCIIKPHPSCGPVVLWCIPNLHSKTSFLVTCRHCPMSCLIVNFLHLLHQIALLLSFILPSCFSNGLNSQSKAVVNYSRGKYTVWEIRRGLTPLQDRRLFLPHSTDCPSLAVFNVLRSWHNKVEEIL